MARPWSKRADELREKEGDWCDYIAWREWITERFEQRDEHAAKFFGATDTAYTTFVQMLTDQSVYSVELYAAFCAAAEEADTFQVGDLVRHRDDMARLYEVTETDGERVIARSVDDRECETRVDFVAEFVREFPEPR